MRHRHTRDKTIMKDQSPSKEEKILRMLKRVLIRSLQSQNPQRANQLSVRLELQADCYAGVWAAKNKDRLEAGDMESGLNAANAIGDDTLMRNAGRRASPEGFTHGTSAQRMEWLRKGMQSADDSVCDALMR